MWPQCSELHCQNETHETPVNCQSRKLKRKIVMVLRRRGLSDRLLRFDVPISKTRNSLGSKTGVERSNPTEYAHVKYDPCQAAHLTETRAKLRYYKQKSAVSRPFARRIRRATEANYVHSLFARLVSDIGTLQQLLYSAKGIWQHPACRFSFLR
jgi:hypothetical protein